MRASERRALEAALRDHYRTGEKGGVAPRALVEAVAAEMARPARPHPGAVVATQLRRVGAATWALHATIVLLVAALALSGSPVTPLAPAVGAALALSSLVGLTRSRSCSMAELESSCAVNAQAVACARIVALGCADAAAMLALALLCADGPGLWAGLAQSCAPYLAAAGVGLLAGRRAASADATLAATVAAAATCAACLAARALFPEAFAPATALAWWIAAAAALAFAVAQARAWLRAAGSAFAVSPARAAAL